MPTEAEIKKMKRGELNELAGQYGIDPDEYRRADDLRSAIFAQLQQPEESEEETETAPAEASAEEASEESPKEVPNPPRPRVERRSKRYRAAHEQIDKTRQYNLEEATELVRSTSTVAFDAAVELHLNLGVDPKQADQLVRSTVVLPHGSGKSQRVAALVPEGQEKPVADAGADMAGYQSVLDAIAKGEIDFDILVAHPDTMKDLSKHAKTLGPQGLMPNPKAGTVTEQVADTVRDLKAGRVEYRVDRYGVIHQTVGRVSFDPQQLADNVRAFVASVSQQKPGSVKDTYFQKATLTSSMGPGIKLDIRAIT